MEVLRFDHNGSPTSFVRTAQGFLRVKARLSRSGIFTYSDKKEYRSNEEVFKQDSLDTLKGAPVTDLHPVEKSADRFLTPANTKEHIIGMAESVERDGNYLKGSLLIFHEDAIKAIESGERKEISLGYKCLLSPNPGVFQGETYDMEQKNIVVNHIALGPKGWGRAGPECSIGKDYNSPPQIKGQTMTETIRLDGVDLALTSENVKNLWEEKKKQFASLSGRFDALGLELKKEQAARAELEKPEAIDAKVNARLKLIDKCRSALGSEARFDGKSDLELKLEVIKKHSPNIDYSDHDESYIDGVFETICQSQSERNDSLNNTRISMENASQSPASAAYEKWMVQSTELWQSPLKGHL